LAFGLRPSTLQYEKQWSIVSPLANRNYTSEAKGFTYERADDVQVSLTLPDTLTPVDVQEFKFKVTREGTRAIAFEQAGRTLRVLYGRLDHAGCIVATAGQVLTGRVQFSRADHRQSRIRSTNRHAAP